MSTEKRLECKCKPAQPPAKPEQGALEPEVSLNQRGWDLLRYKRQELLSDGLITEDEYTYLLVEVKGAVKRLEDYDATVAALAASHSREKEPQVCEKVMHMYVWTRPPRWIGVAQAENVEKAREILLEEIGTSRDGSCPEREAADKYVRENTPAIWHQRNAEFALTDSAELREQELHSATLEKRVKELESREKDGR